MSMFIIYYTNEDGKIQMRSYFAPDANMLKAFVDAIPQNQILHYQGVTVHQNIPEQLLVVDEATGKSHAELFISMMDEQYNI